MHRQDRRHACAGGSAEDRAVEHVDAGPCGRAWEEERVPGDVPRDRGERGRGRPTRVATTSTSSRRRERAAEAVHPARGTRASLDERGDVETDPHPTASSKARRWISPVRRHVNPAACARPRAASSSRRSSASRMRRSHRLGVVRIHPHRGVAARLVEGLVGRGDHRDAAGHRLDDRDAEPLEPRRVGEDRRAAHERGRLRVGDEAELQDRRIVQQRRVAPAGRAREPRARARRGAAAMPRRACRGSCAAPAWRG